MVRRPFQAAWLLVDAAAAAAVCQCLAGKHQVDTQAAISPEVGRTVVPPAVTLFFLVKQAGLVIFQSLRPLLSLLAYAHPNFLYLCQLHLVVTYTIR